MIISGCGYTVAEVKVVHRRSGRYNTFYVQSSKAELQKGASEKRSISVNQFKDIKQDSVDSLRLN